MQASILLPTPGDWASTLSADLLQGASFHPDEERTRLGWLGRWSNGFLLGEKGALEAGVSGAVGADHVEEELAGYLGGADCKAKFYFPAASQLTLQAEALFRHSHSVDSVGGATEEERWGFYAFTDFRYRTRCHAGALYEQWEREGDAGLMDRSVRAFLGYSVLEESTLIRLAYEYSMPAGDAGVNALSLQFLFSMGPHKPHQF